MAATTTSTAFRIIQHTVPCQYIREYPRALAGEQEDTLHLSVKQYIPLNNPNPRRGDVTIVAAHANAFPKEIYEPLWEDLVRLVGSKADINTDGRNANHVDAGDDNTANAGNGEMGNGKRSGVRIRSIWIADVANQGASGLLNEPLLGNDPSLADHSRDLLYLINLKRAEMPRPIIGIGHSMGGQNLVGTALIHPRLFTSLVLLDPIIQPRLSETKTENGVSAVDIRPLRSAMFRKNSWPSRQAARAELGKSPFYRSWDPRVLDRWVEYGLTEVVPNGISQRGDDTTPTTRRGDTTTTTTDSDGRDQSGSHNAARPVILTTSPSQEAFTFVRPNLSGYGVDGKPVDRSTHADLDPRWPHISPFYRPEVHSTFEQLPHLRPSTLYIFASDSVISSAEEDARKLAATGTGVGGSGGVAAGRVKGVTLEKVGHLIPMQTGAVQRAAQVIAHWLEQEVEQWRHEDDDFRQAWIAKSKKEKQLVDDTWVQMVLGVGAPSSRSSEKKETMTLSASTSTREQARGSGRDRGGKSKI